MEQVILVDENDNETGLMEKLEAHRQGLLHRAVSVFIFNSKQEFLLQKRAKGKYHSAGLWSNTACSHPFPGEGVAEAAQRRLAEEMGIIAPLTKKFSFIYKVQLDNSLFEHELDHVFTGFFEGSPSPDVSEVEEWKWISRQELVADVDRNPASYSAWFRILVKDQLVNL
jgi:isopentenyl-diphosphate Delta-isomerase